MRFLSIVELRHCQHENNSDFLFCFAVLRVCQQSFCGDFMSPATIKYT